MKTFLLLLPLLAAVACTSPELVVANRLAPGGGVAGDGGTGPAPGPTLDIAVRIESDATDFNPGDILQLFVNGVSRTDEVVIGGNYAILRLDPPPAGDQFVELFRRTGPILDSFTYQPQPYTGPTVASSAPESAMAGAPVTITGTGFAAGTVRVFFGGVEGTVDASDDTSITATVPDGARTGVVFVLVGADAALGVAAFQLLDGTGAPVPIPEDESDPQLFAVFPGRGVVETVVRIYGANLDDLVRPHFNDRQAGRIFDIQDVELNGITGVQSAFAVVDPFTDPGAGAVFLERLRIESDPLPFTVD